MPKLAPTFPATKNEGHFELSDPVGWEKYIAGLKDGNYLLSIKRRYKTRSLDQNAYYWGVVVALIADYIGETPDETHEILKSMFLREKHRKTVEGKIIEYVTIQSTASLKTIAYEDYLRRIREWASAFLSLYIPLPNEAAY